MRHDFCLKSFYPSVLPALFGGDGRLRAETRILHVLQILTSALSFFRAFIRVSSIRSAAGAPLGRVVLLLVGLGLGAGLGACQNRTPVQQNSAVDEAFQQTGGGGVTQALDLVSDVPVPSGSILDTSRSLVLGRGTQWTGRLVLRITLGPVQTLTLFQREMPSFGWTSILAVQEEVGRLVFTRDNYAISIVVEPQGLTGSRAVLTKQSRQDEPSVPFR